MTRTSASKLSFRKYRLQLLALLAAGIVGITPADAQTIRGGLLRPVIVALDGISVFATLLAFSRTEPYLARALAEQWNLKICEFAKFRDDPDACDIVPVPWNGQLRDTAQLASYLVQATALIEAIVGKQLSRPLVVVAHSWGSVVAYQALSELQGRVAPDSVAVLATLGSPLHASTRSVAGKTLIGILKALPTRIPGQELVEGAVARKPDTVSHWVNYWIDADIISSPIPVADENERVVFLNPATAHFAYYDQSDLFTLLSLAIGTRNDFVCNNLLWSGQSVPADFAAPYDFASSKQELNVHVDCADPPYGESEYGVTLEVGTGKVVGSTAKEVTEIIWPKAYVWRGDAWQQITLSAAAFGQKFAGWIEGHAEARVAFEKPRPFVDEQQIHHVVAYTCRWIEGMWKCGCQDSTCSIPKWQLQSFTWK